MTYILTLGNPAYSSWSLRGWLPFAHFGIPVELEWVEFSKSHARDQIKHLGNAQTVPVLRSGEAIVADSLAIIEELASRHPEYRIWPTAAADRARARTLACEMHSGFTALRSQCPMNLRQSYENVPINDALAADLERLDTLWAEADEGLCGEICAADFTFAPVALRILGYDLPIKNRAYAERLANLPAVRDWRRLAATIGDSLARYDKSWGKIDSPLILSE